MTDPVADLLAYIDGSPTPYHAAAETARRLEAAGFRALDQAEMWTLAPRDRCYAVRGGSILAFVVGESSPAEAGFRVIGSHTDSPNLRLKPSPDASAHGYRQLAVEPYGGVLFHTWLDRDLSIAGRVALRGERGLESRLVSFGRPLVRIPSLAIHLNRDVNTAGLVLNAQQHLAPLAGLASAPAFNELLAAEVDSEEILGADLMLYDTQPADLTGAREEFIVAPRLDNLASCHAATTALAREAELVPFTRLVVLYDHEEVGSRSAEGAAGPFLEHALSRIVAATDGEPQALARAIARSHMVSADMAHAVHPNYADRHEPAHRPVVGGGPTIKRNAGQSYATDAATEGVFTLVCRETGVEPQHFVTRSDLPCGSTIGPITAARIGLPTVDVGNPMLSMHSCRELAGAADVAPMIGALSAFLSREDF